MTVKVVAIGVKVDSLLVTEPFEADCWVCRISLGTNVAVVGGKHT